MSKQKLVIQHDLSKMSAEQLHQYLRDVSEFIGLDPDLNALDTIWMDNEQGPGKSLVIYARRGTAEILRNNRKIDVLSLTDKMVKGSIVFTAIGKDGEGRQEIATGSKFIDNLSGKGLDDGIMTASTRATRRLTMQFTSLGILDESEVRASVADLSNPASQVTLSGSPMVIPPPPVAANNAPGKLVEAPVVGASARALNDSVDGWVSANLGGKPYIREGKVLTPEEAQNEFVANQASLQAHAIAFLQTTGEGAVQASVAPPAASVTEIIEASALPKRARRQKNTVSMDVEPETVQAAQPILVALPVTQPIKVDTPIQSVPTSLTSQAIAQVNDAVTKVELASADKIFQQEVTPVPVLVTGVPNTGTDFAGKPTDAQMADYRKRVSVYTSQLPSSENLGSVQKMRAFITKASGTAPQFMSTDQWEEMLFFFNSFVNQNTTKGLVKYINDSLGVK